MPDPNAPEYTARHYKKNHTKRAEGILPLIRLPKQVLQGVILHQRVGNYISTETHKPLSVDINGIFAMLLRPIGQHVHTLRIFYGKKAEGETEKKSGWRKKKPEDNQ